MGASSRTDFSDRPCLERSRTKLLMSRRVLCCRLLPSQFNMIPLYAGWKQGLITAVRVGYYSRLVSLKCACWRVSSCGAGVWTVCTYHQPYISGEVLAIPDCLIMLP